MSGIELFAGFWIGCKYKTILDEFAKFYIMDNCFAEVSELILIKLYDEMIDYALQCKPQLFCI